MIIRKIKLTIFIFWMFAVCALFSSVNFLSVSGQIRTKPDDSKKTFLNPEPAVIEEFDRKIQKRFLTNPFFGIARMEPPYLKSRHLGAFYSQNLEEQTSVENFEKDNWNVTMYLFGRRAAPELVNGKATKKFKIEYRVNHPLIVTKDLAEKDIQPGEKLLPQIKNAFIAFQTPGSPQENEYSFAVGNWSYIAKPVRAVNESCLTCHTDYVITAKLGSEKFKFRQRKVGDANGVIVYGFNKKD